MLGVGTPDDDRLMITTPAVDINTHTQGLPHQQALVAALSQRVHQIIKPAGWHQQGTNLCGPAEPSLKQREAADAILRAARQLNDTLIGECETLATAAFSIAIGEDGCNIWELIHRMDGNSGSAAA